MRTIGRTSHPYAIASYVQVGVEKEKVNTENELAQKEAEKCKNIASEVAIKQASCEHDLAAAEPLVAQVGNCLYPFSMTCLLLHDCRYVAHVPACHVLTRSWLPRH